MSLPGLSTSLHLFGCRTSAPTVRPSSAKAFHDAAASKGNLSFRDTSAWRDRSVIYRLISRVTPNFTGRTPTGPRAIRRWTAWPGLSLWRSALRCKGVQSPQQASGPAKNVLVEREDGVLELKEEVEKKGTFEKEDGSKFNWAFSQKVELTFGVGRDRSQEQKLVGFAYEVSQRSEVAGCDSDEKSTTSNLDFTKNDRPVVVIFGGHGVPVEQMSRAGFLGGCVGKTYVDELQANVLALNYRGYGQSTSGITSNRSMVEDGVAIVNHLLDSGVDAKRIVLHGYSMGGNIAANVLQAAEAKGNVLGGLILDRSMEKLSTGAATMSATKSDSVSKRVLCNYFLSPLARSVAYCLAESYSTRLAIKGIQKHRTTQVNDQSGRNPTRYSTPIVAVYDDDPIGSTTKRMCEKYGIETWETGEGHDAGFGATLDALEELRDGMPEENVENSNVSRLLKIFEAEPQKTAEQKELDPDAAELISGPGVSSLKAEAESNVESEESRISLSHGFDAKKFREETWKQTDPDL